MRAFRVAHREASVAKRANLEGVAPFACILKTARAVCWILEALASRVSGSQTSPSPRRDSPGMTARPPVSRTARSNRTRDRACVDRNGLKRPKIETETTRDLV